MKLTSILILSLTVTGPLNAEIFKWVDDNGKIHFSDKKPTDQTAKKVEVNINTYESVTYKSSLFDTGKNVVMYSTRRCKYCAKARKYFKKNNIKFKEYDVDTNAKGRRDYNKMGAKGVPVILVGKKRMNGFSEKGFKRIYQ